jgi:hypothetical protein
MAVAPDLFWRQEPGVDLNVTSEVDWQHGLRLYGAYDRGAGTKDVKDTLNAVRKLPECNGKIAALGYCLGALVCGLLLLVATYLAICYIWTPTTPTIVLAPAIFLQGFCIGPVILAAGNVVTANAPVAYVNDISTTYFFVRQLGNTFGVTAATVLFDRRMTLHSLRLLDTSNRLDATTRSTLAQYAHLIHRSAALPAIPRWEHCSCFKIMWSPRAGCSPT